MRTIRLLLVAIPVYCCPYANAQENQSDSSLRASAIHTALHIYQEYSGKAAPLFLATQYEEYAMLIQTGHPFFKADTFLTGTVVYDNIRYENLLLKYDLTLGQLVLSDPKSMSRLALPGGKVEAFNIGQYDFENFSKTSLRNLPRNGYYQVLYRKNDFRLLKSETKRVEQEMTNKSTVQRYVISDISYYVATNGLCSPMNRRSQALELFSDRRSQVREFLRKHHTDFTKDSDLTDLVIYYTSLK